MSESRHGGGDTVSIVVAERNEEQRIEELVARIAAQDFAGDVEVMVADGASSDRSVARLEAAASRFGVPLTVVENPQRLIPHALNACVRRARGDFVVRMDCRAGYPRDYVRSCLAAARETGAWNVGGMIVPEGRTRAERAVACAMDGPFGGIGWTRHAASAGRVQTDTVYCGTFPRHVFERIGGYDESLPWNEDEDLNFRVRRAGGRVVLDPGIRVPYLPRGSARELFLQYYRIGQGKVDVMRKHRRVLSARSLAPLALVGSVGVLAAASARSVGARRLLEAELMLYAAAALTFAAESIRRRHEEWSLLPMVVRATYTMHAAYGAGMLHGLLEAATSGRGRAA
jgi:succinoglycan biosynthesis protein ExoA